MYSTELYIPGICDSGLNVWFVDYEQAKQYCDQRSGVYLLPYRHHFFVCKSAHVEKLGLDPNDSDWGKIGFDWVCPLDIEAKSRLEKKLRSKPEKKIVMSNEK